LYVLPVVFAVGGIAFPVGTILYWTSSNLWTMGQQFYVIRNNPAPGTPAFDAKQEREREKRRKKGLPDAEIDIAEANEAAAEKRPAKRTQPKSQTRSQRKKAGTSAGRSTTQKDGGTK
ncbi:MAG TPA: membrane protein insertase YidC, partial [Nocardioides sp.]